jgi:hypothetical protein
MNIIRSLKILACFSVMSLSACVSDTAPPPNLDLSSTRPSEHNLYTVHINPVATPIVINKMHAWEIKVAGPSGEAIDHAKISFSGGMPQHSHGFPSEPKVTQELGDGRYLLEGMKFSMPGWWEIILDIQSASGVDKVKFNTVLPAAG